ncbi:cupin domain-containing protein [Streptomyces sp. MBT65]|uniref:cupin domain-containing protein n=1 Tax=Streptomyces sp. MBT65 TaxID=1488395 RepID=UPI001F2D3CA5|nr:cupin domain-containing protein [Streptomyces sp. MBT65]
MGTSRTSRTSWSCSASRPGCRRTWHSHGLGQTLYIVEGIALIQSRGGGILEAHPGDVVWTPPGEEHWHGAAPDHFMVHIAL